MMFRLILVIFLALTPASSIADTNTVRDRIVLQLREDGYREIRIYRTFLGRMRFVANRPDRRREIVVNPRTGVILRDYIRFLSQSSGSSGITSSGQGKGSRNGDDDEYDDDEYDDDEYDDEDNSGHGSSDDDDDDDDDESDNSGSGSSGSGGSDDDDESDNSGSGSSNSGSGSGGSDDDDDD